MSADDFDLQLELRALLFDRVARSMAHCVGNASNVVAGRLSLLEMENSLTERQADTLKRTRDRLYDLQQELQNALDFGGLLPSSNGQTESVVQQLLALQAPSVLRLEGAESLPAEHAVRRPILGLRYLLNACRLATPGREVVWKVSPGAVETGDVVLRLELGEIEAPPSRRALLEPWFSLEALEQHPSDRYRRLVLAQALGLLEDSIARFAARPSQSNEARADVIEVTWSRE